MARDQLRNYGEKGTTAIATTAMSTRTEPTPKDPKRENCYVKELVARWKLIVDLAKRSATRSRENFLSRLCVTRHDILSVVASFSCPFHFQFDSTQKNMNFLLSNATCARWIKLATELAIKGDNVAEQQARKSKANAKREL